MSIEPAGSGASGPIDPSRVGGSRPSDATARPEVKPIAESASRPAEDRVEFSSTAREIAGPRESGSGLAPERVREVLDRIATGFYDQPHVLDQVAERVLQDPDFSPTE